ncbi:CbiX/SirB N-terminal domain-containing protein [Ostreiculturibacter nitratireducens]|uniref:sirohydrochlorin chelatase n=1 Tax=Ostreiculturibacter nitratireducens TaxID=3075226 RepID=UPI0031B5A798
MTREALIVAHGQPSDPDGPEAEIEALAARVAALLPGWRVGGATLAAPGALEAAVAELEDPVVFPFFMSDGWFIRSNLPARLAKAGRDGLRILTPFGLLPGANALALRLAREEAAEAGWAAPDTTLILAAHGSGRSPQPAETARETAGYIAERADFAEVRVGFIEQDPRIAQVLIEAGRSSILLPLFVARWGHVLDDIPAAVEEAGFRGRILPPLGTHRDVPAIIAEAISKAVAA